MPGTIILDSGSGNLHSVHSSLEHVGCDAAITNDPMAVRHADRLIVPGQGAFQNCMAELRERGLDDAIREFAASGRPYLGICLGLQVLFDDSGEHGGSTGLGLIPGHVVRFDSNQGELKVPHIGWNSIHSNGREPLMKGIPEGGHFYFVHSYYVVPEDPEIIVMRATYGADFAAAIRYENLFACQFHPEKSQALGLELLNNFVRS